MNILFYLELIVFISIFAINFVKKNSYLVYSYIIQSFAIVLIIASEGFESRAWQLIVISLVVFSIKVVIAPYYFFRFVRKSKQNLLTSTYLGVPLSLLAITLIVFLSNSDVFQPLRSFIGEGTANPTILIASVFTSIFILINRKGSLSQIIGILSLENSIVAIGLFLGITQRLIIEIGILFDVFVFLILSIIFIEMIHKSLKTTDVSQLNNLKD